MADLFDGECLHCRKPLVQPKRGRRRRADTLRRPQTGLDQTFPGASLVLAGTA